MFDELVCANCELEIAGVDESDVCMHCGEPLCDTCYAKSPYCPACEEEMQEASNDTAE